MAGTSLRHHNMKPVTLKVQLRDTCPDSLACRVHLQTWQSASGRTLCGTLLLPGEASYQGRQFSIVISGLWDPPKEAPNF